MSDDKTEAVPAREYPASIHNRGPARASGYADGVLTLLTERAHPPGRPLELTVQLPDAMLTLSAKVIGSKRRDDGHYEVRLKLSSVRREQRASLEAAFAAVAAG